MISVGLLSSIYCTHYSFRLLFLFVIPWLTRHIEVLCLPCFLKPLQVPAIDDFNVYMHYLVWLARRWLSSEAQLSSGLGRLMIGSACCSCSHDNTSVPIYGHWWAHDGLQRTVCDLTVLLCIVCLIYALIVCHILFHTCRCTFRRCSYLEM